MWILHLFVWKLLLTGVETVASCTFPSNLASKTWRDSDKGNLVFTTDEMTGWNFNYNSASSKVPYTPTWECYNTTTEGSDLILIVKSKLPVQYDSSTNYRPFLCMKLVQVTDVSYYYYLQFAEQTVLYYERITVYPESSISSISDLTLCLPSTDAAYPSTSEYHMLILNGSESQAIHDCPTSMYELYTYTVVDTDANTVACTGGVSRVDMCSDIKRMTFNYTLCNTLTAYSGNGSLFCLVVLDSGSDTLYTVYNEDTAVDNTNTYRFTCFMSSVASDGAVSMSVSPRSCTKTQTPTAQPQLGDGTILGLNMNLSPIQSILTCEFPCAIPSYFANLNWTDSDKGELLFTTDSMSGWSFYADGTFVSPTWKCFHTTIVGDSTILILRGSSTISVYDDIFRPFLCLNLQQITDVSFYYYLLWAEQELLGYERITIVKDSDESSITDPYDELCVNTSQSTAYPTTNEYHLLIKQGSESSAKQDCPSSFYGVYAYTLENKNTGDTFCASNDSSWDVCTDYQKMSINYTHCTTTVAYSATGSLSCVFNLTSGSNEILTVYNEDSSVDNVNTFRFTCFVFVLSSGGNLTVSQSPKSCTKSQTPYNQPALTNGTFVGLNLNLSPFVNGLCPLPTLSGDASSTNIAVIIGSVLGGLALIGIIAAVLLCLYCKKCCCKCKSKVATELNNNDSKVTDEKGKEKAKDELINETETLTTKEDGIINENKNGSLHSGKELEDEDHLGEKVKPEDDSMNEDLLLTPSSVDIASLFHIRTHSRMDTPCGTAPGDTTFRENEDVPVFNSFTLPYLQGKSLTTLSGSLSREKTDVNSPSLLNGNGLKSAPIAVDVMSGINSSKQSSEDINSEMEKETKTKGNDNKLPDNPVIISSHFQEQKMSYMNTFMDLPRKATVGPNNDHDFREKRTYSDAPPTGPKTNTIFNIMSKEPGFKPFMSTTSPKNNDKSRTIKEDPKRKGDANYLLESANTFTTRRNKSGLFQVSVSPDLDTSDSVHDDTIDDGIAYDEDNQKIRKHVQFSPEKNTVRELTDYDFEYGVVKGKIPPVTKTINVKKSKVTIVSETTKDNMNTHVKNACTTVGQGNSKSSDEDTNTEDVMEGDGTSNDSFTIDNSRLKTAMSVLYSEGGDDPDHMTVSGYDL